MSFILDALRKSEQERRQAESLVLTQGPPALELPRRRLAPWVAGASAAVVAFVAAIYWVLLERRSEPAMPVATTASTNAPRSPESAATTVGPSAPIESRAETPAPPELKPHPLVQATETPGARDLAAEAQVAARQPARAPRAAVTSAAPPAVANSPAPAGVKLLRTMPLDFQRSLPELTVNIHIYAPREADRILYINNHEYHSGERVGDGIVVEEIVEDGAVLSFHGQRFKLPRPS